jgi:tetratricopeptide (TPR) repeat protein
MMKKHLLIIIILLPIFISVAQNNNSADAKLLTFKNSIQEESIGKYAQAILTLMKIYDKYSKEYTINLRLGWLYYLNKDYDSSIKYYKNALAISYNKSIEAMLGATLPLADRGDWDKVKDYYNMILDSDENNYTANLRLGQIDLNTGNYLSAKSYLTKLIEMYPGDYETNLYLAWTYYYLGDNSTAYDLFIEVLTLIPGEKSALEGLKLIQ